MQVGKNAAVVGLHCYGSCNAQACTMDAVLVVLGPVP